MSNETLTGIPPSIVDSLADFTGRVWVLHRIEQWLRAGKQSTFLLTGGPGSGKSTLAARLVQFSNGLAVTEKIPPLHRQWLTYAHFCQAQVDSTLNPLRFIEALATHLAERCQPFAQALAQAKSDHSISINVTINTVESGSEVNVVVIKALNIGAVPARTAFDQLVRQPLEQLCTPDFQDLIVILVDSLDEAWTFNQDENLLSLLDHVKSNLPAQVRLLLTSRPDPQVLNIFGPSSLDLVEDRPQEVDDVRQYIAGKLQALPEPRWHELTEQVATAASSNFLYARYVLDDLLSRLDQIGVQHLALPEDLEDIYRQFLKRELGNNLQRWNEQYGPLLGAIAVSRGAGLTRDQLFGVIQLRQNPQLTQGKLNSMLQACAQFLSSPTREGPFRLYHQSFRDFLLADNEFPIYPDEANQDIANYFLEEHEDWFADEERYALQSLVTHLIEASRQTQQRRIRKQLIKRLIALLTDFTFLEAKTALLGVDALLDDLRAALTLPLAEHPSPFDLLTFVRLLDQKSHLFRGWNQLQHPVYFAQQMYVWAADWGISTLSSQAESRLVRLDQPYLALRWRVGPESSPLLLRTLKGHSSDVNAVILTSDGQRAVTASSDGTLIVWDLASGEVLHTLTGHSEAVTAVALTSDGQRAVSASLDGMLIVWDLASGQALQTFTAPEAVMAVALTSDGQRAVSASRDGTLIVWDLHKGGEAATLNTGVGLTCMALQSDFAVLVVGAATGNLYCLDLLDVKGW